MKEDFNELLNMICPENDIFGCFEIAIDPPTMQEDEGDLKIHLMLRSEVLLQYPVKIGFQSSFLVTNFRAAVYFSSVSNS